MAAWFKAKVTNQVPGQPNLWLPVVCIVREPESQSTPDLFQFAFNTFSQRKKLICKFEEATNLVPAATGITPCKFSGPEVNARSLPQRGSTREVGVNARPPGWRSAKKNRPPSNCLWRELR